MDASEGLNGDSQPVTKSGGPAIDTQRYHIYNDMVLSKWIEPCIVDKLRSFKFHDEDVLISTYPRSGTTWTQEMTWLICNDADVETASRVGLNTRSRFIEYRYRLSETPEMDHLEQCPPPRIIKTHFPADDFQGQLEQNGSSFKVIVTMRNLKDVLTSTFHIAKKLYGFTGTWVDFFERFQQDLLEYGSWAKHCLSWWRLRDNKRVLFLKYEDIKRNPRQGIKRIADFIGKTLTDEQVSTIVEYTSFEKMRGMESYNKVDSVAEAYGVPKKDIIHKGVVGGWQELFTADQIKYVNQYLRDTTEKEGLYFDDHLN